MNNLISSFVSYFTLTNYSKKPARVEVSAAKKFRLFGDVLNVLLYNQIRADHQRLDVFASHSNIIESLRIKMQKNVKKK